MGVPNKKLTKKQEDRLLLDPEYYDIGIFYRLESNYSTQLVDFINKQTDMIAQYSHPNSRNSQIVICTSDIINYIHSSESKLEDNITIADIIIFTPLFRGVKITKPSFNKELDDLKIKYPKILFLDFTNITGDFVTALFADEEFIKFINIKKQEENNSK